MEIFEIIHKNIKLSPAKNYLVIHKFINFYILISKFNHILMIAHQYLRRLK
jgi:hypothetical protein